MRDQFAPMIEGFDLNGIVDPYSFQCTPFYIEGDNGGTLMDGTTIHDILEEKVRLSWTFNALYIDQYTALSDALNSGESPDTVTAYAYDLTRNAVILAKFHASLPEFNFVSAYGQTMGISNGELVLEEAELLAWFTVTLPSRHTFWRGEMLPLTGFTVMQYDKDGNGTNITAQCAFSTVEEVELLTDGDMTVPVDITLPDGFKVIIDWNITVVSIVAHGDWWALFRDGTLDIFIEGSIPDYSNTYREWHSTVYVNPPPWVNHRSSIRSIIFEESVTKIGAYNFFDCSNLTEVTIPENVTYVKNFAFYKCALASVTIADATLEGNAFSNCNGITNVTIPASVLVSGANAFWGDSGRYNLRTIPNITIFGNRVTSIRGVDIHGIQHGFGGSNIVNVTILDGITDISYKAFFDCKSLHSVTISAPNSRMSIQPNVFSGCTALTSATLQYGISYVTSAMFQDCTALTDVTILPPVSTIGESMFQGCTSLTEITIPESVGSISSSAFRNCSYLTEVAILRNSVTVGDYAFYGCYRLRYVYFGGTKLQLRNQLYNISRRSGNAPLFNATLYYNSTGLRIGEIYYVDVNFSSNGGTGTMETLTTSNLRYTLPQSTFTPPDGYYFKAWYVNGVEYSPGSNLIMTGDTTVVALWEEYPVCTFDANGGTGTMNPVHVSDYNYTLPENGFTPPDDMQFRAWGIWVDEVDEDEDSPSE